jgi:predicted transcriptional regulator
VAEPFVTNAQLVERALSDDWQTSTELTRAAGCSRSAASGALFKLFKAGLVERRGTGLTGEPYSYRRTNSPGGRASAPSARGLGRRLSEVR